MLSWTTFRPGREFSALTCPVQPGLVPAYPRQAAVLRRKTCEEAVYRALENSTRCSASASTPAESSFDAEDELDSGPSQELAKYDVERFRQQSQHLELMWRIQRVCNSARDVS